VASGAGVSSLSFQRAAMKRSISVRAQPAASGAGVAGPTGGTKLQKRRPSSNVIARRPDVAPATGAGVAGAGAPRRTHSSSSATSSLGSADFGGIASNSSLV